MLKFTGLVVSGISVALLVSAASVLPAQAVHRVTSAATAPEGVESVAARDRGEGEYRAPEGPFFNDPRGGADTAYRIERQIMRAIDATPRKQTIRIALYSFDRLPVAQALLRASSRGVNVQILLNDHQDTAAMKALRARLGTDTDRRSFIYKCHSSCRGDHPKRYLHTKFYTFTRAGRSRNVLMFGSANLTLNAVRHQWNDLYFTSGNKPLFDQYVALFNDMVVDYRTQQPPLEFCGAGPADGVACDNALDPFTTVVFPRYVGRHNDPVISILDRVQCLTQTATGVKRTRLVLSMHTMRGNRGDYLSAAIRNKYAEGCDFRVQYGLIGYYTKGILGARTSRGRIPLRSSGYDFDGDEEVDRYTHQKYLVIRGNYAGDPEAALTFTGSSNWATLGAVNDEIMVSVPGRNVARKYVRNFNLIWRGDGNSRNAYTTSQSRFRGTPTTRIGAEPIRGAGAHWEAD